MDGIDAIDLVDSDELRKAAGRPLRPTASRALAAFAAESGAVLLDSAVPGDPRSRSSWLARRPVRVVEQRDGAVLVDGAPSTEGLLETARRVLAETRPRSGADAGHGGLVGFIGYEAARSMALGSSVPGASGQQAWLGLYPAIVRYAPEPDDPALAPPSAETAAWTAELSREAVEQRIARLMSYIEAGDVYQANFTQRFKAELPPGLAPFDLYRRLRRRAPGPFSAFLNTGALQLLSVSPERFVALDSAGAIETRPIKGTRPRSADPFTDDALAAELAASAKDRAENLMIADLMRNDLSRVAVPGSVRVPSLCALERFPGAHHLVSVVTAQLPPGLDAFDLLAAMLPGGSITGAPKVRAMQLIEALEAGPRGPYCGVMVRIGWDGSLDSSILIRTLVVEDGRVSAQAGGGIVADSEPAAEYEEAMVKLRPLLAALAEGA